jgi:hypothetical protein
MESSTLSVYVLTRLFINPEGEVSSKNFAVTLDVFEAEAHKAAGVENDFDILPLPKGWCEDAEQSSLVACMREFRRAIEESHAAALE